MEDSVFLLLLYLPAITYLKQLCLPYAHSWQTRHSLRTSQPKLSRSWTGLDSLTQDTRAHYCRRQPSPMHNTKKAPTPFILDILKGAYWKVITLHIGYILKCLLTENVFIEWNMSIDQKSTYWMERCLLTENMHIDWKCGY